MNYFSWIFDAIPALIGAIIGATASIAVIKIEANNQNKIENRKIAIEYIMHKIYKIEENLQSYDDILKHVVPFNVAMSTNNKSELLRISKIVNDFINSENRTTSKIFAYLPIDKINNIKQHFENYKKAIENIKKDNYTDITVLTFKLMQEIHTLLTVEIMLYNQRLQKNVDMYIK